MGDSIDRSMFATKVRDAPTDVLRLEEVIARESMPSSTISRAFAQNIWVYAAVRLITETFAQVPFELFKKTKKTNSRRNGYEQINEHPLIDLMDQPNEIMDTETFLEAWAVRLLTYGNVWIELGMNNSRGIPRELLIWGGSEVTPEIDFAKNKLLWWNVTSGGQYYRVELDEMIHTSLPNPYHPFLGVPPTVSMAAQLDADFARTLFDKSFFRNNANPDAILSSKYPLSPKQRQQVRDSWYETHGGLGRNGGLAVLGGDFDLKVLGRPHAESQFIENRSFTRQEVASAYKIPVILINDLDNNSMTREAFTAAHRVLYDSAILPLTNKFKKGINNKITNEIDRSKKIMFDFNFDTLPVMTSYLAEKAEVFAKMVRSGVAVNTMGRMLDLDMDPIPGGDKGYLPGNFLSLEALSELTGQQIPAPGFGKKPGIEFDDGNEDEEGEDDGNQDEDDIFLEKKEKQKPRHLPYRQLEDSGDQEGNRADALIINSLATKIKRFIFDLRKESLRYGNFKLKLNNKRWIRQVLPACAMGIYIGHGNDGKVRSVFESKGQEDVDQFLHELQMRADTFEFSHPGMEEAVFSIIERGFQEINDFWDRIEEGEDIKDVFSSLQKKSKDLARFMINKSLDSGRRLVQEDF